jgi:hypothetical protein
VTWTDAFRSFCEDAGVDMAGINLDSSLNQLDKKLRQSGIGPACITCFKKTPTESQLRTHLRHIETHIYPLATLKKEKAAVLALIAASKDDAGQKENVCKAKLIFAVKQALLIHL